MIFDLPSFGCLVPLIIAAALLYRVLSGGNYSSCPDRPAAKPDDACGHEEAGGGELPAIWR